MKYKYSRKQIFRKKLDVPNEILEKVYNNDLTFLEYVNYNLVDKIPISCLRVGYRQLVDKFGIEKCMNLDFEMINNFYFGGHYNMPIKYIDSNVLNLNKAITESVIKDNKWKHDYLKLCTKRMKQELPEYFLEDGLLPLEVSKRFYSGNLFPLDIIKYFDILKDKEIGDSLSKDVLNTKNITKEQIEFFVSNYKDLLSIFLKDSTINTKINAIDDIVILLTDNNISDDEKEQFIKNYVKSIVSFSSNITDLEYKTAFKYISFKDFCIDKFGKIKTDSLLSKNSEEYIFNCGIPMDILLDEDFFSEAHWLINLFSDLEDRNKVNQDRLKICLAYTKIQDRSLQHLFTEYILKKKKNIQIEEIENISDIFQRLSFSNSNEVYVLRCQIANEIMKSKNPLETLNNIENIFIKNNMPTVGKIYLFFDMIHPNFEGFNFNESMISPTLKKSSNMGRKVIVFSDLVKSFLGSNNRSLNDFIKNIEVGSKLYSDIKDHKINYNDLLDNQRVELIKFSKCLSTLYNNTLLGKNKDKAFVHSENVVDDIYELSKKISLDGSLDYNLADRVISMFCHFASIDTLEEAKKYVKNKVQMANIRNRNTANSQITLEKGDFVKGIGDITYLKDILQNGSVSKEFLGSSSDSDLTPLDTDLSMILESEGSFEDKIRKTVANSYGPIWFVLKNDDRFVMTRTDSQTLDVKNDMSKMEVFYTGSVGKDHYGIRTGFSSSEINYIVMNNYDPRVFVEIAKNGFYIPVTNKEGKIMFTPDDYDKLRKQMQGLSYYGEDNYEFSSNLVNEETNYIVSQMDASKKEIEVKKEKLIEKIKNSFDKLGLKLKTNIDGDLTHGFVELIDTGSTARGTNQIGDGDFDFIMRLDKDILFNVDKLKEVKQTLLKEMGKEDSNELTNTGDFRFKNVQISPESNVDLDITFTKKIDKISYSTDMALQDRLNVIKKIDPLKYNYVVANIILAKQVLKESGVYKSERSATPQGGLGGVGIENWILQNGGSFIDASKSFLDASNGKNFEQFKANYHIWDFGENHIAERRGEYPHDDFVSLNMSKEGYEKMIHVLKNYMKNYNTNTNSETIYTQNSSHRR